MTDPLSDLDLAPGDPLGVALAGGIGAGFAAGDRRVGVATDDPVALVARVEREVGPRWTWWDRATSDLLVAAGVAVARSWDVVTVDRLLAGRWRTSPAHVWARLHDVATAPPALGQLDLLSAAAHGGDPADPVGPDGHLRPEWVAGDWRADPDHLAAWAGLALQAASVQRGQLAALGPRAVSSAHAESAAELLCAGLEHRGLPIDTAEAERIITAAVGPRPAGDGDALRSQDRRDAEVLRHLGPGPSVNLRNPAEVKAMLRRVGVDVADTRAWRLERHRDDHPVVAALLEWRKAERIATTYGYRWLDEHVAGGRLRGHWSSCDGAAGRMTASAGLHNLPAEMRPAVAAEPGHRFVRADLGQVEPRVLAAVSGDPALIAATADDDLYAPVAARLGVARSVAKVAVLGAMYGSTTGQSAHALRGLEREYPVAMRFLEDAAAAGRRGEDVFTVGGRRVRMGAHDEPDGDLDRAVRVAAALGRFARNAVIQGAAAELFKVWAVLTERRVTPLGAEVVLCLHDELLVHAPADHAPEAAAELTHALAEAAYRWSPRRGVRFVADVAVIDRWSDAAH